MLCCRSEGLSVVVVADLKALKRDVSLKGYSANDQAWWHSMDNDLAFFYFAKTDSIRDLCIRIHTSGPFDAFILGVIFLSTVLMVRPQHALELTAATVLSGSDCTCGHCAEWV